MGFKGVYIIRTCFRDVCHKYIPRYTHFYIEKLVCAVVFMSVFVIIVSVHCKKVQVGKDQEKTQSEKDSHSKNRGGKKPK